MALETWHWQGQAIGSGGSQDLAVGNSARTRHRLREKVIFQTLRYSKTRRHHLDRMGIPCEGATPFLLRIPTGRDGGRFMHSAVAHLLGEMHSWDEEVTTLSFSCNCELFCTIFDMECSCMVLPAVWSGEGDRASLFVIHVVSRQMCPEDFALRLLGLEKVRSLRAEAPKRPRALGKSRVERSDPDFRRSQASFGMLFWPGKRKLRRA